MKQVTEYVFSEESNAAHLADVRAILHGLGETVSQKEIAIRRREEGACTVCGRPAAGGYLRCEKCREKEREHYHATPHPSEVRTPDEPETERVCMRCKEKKPLNAFPLSKYRRNGVEKVFRRHWCYSCTLDYSKNRRRKVTT
jgi:hypothetical protein